MGDLTEDFINTSFYFRFVIQNRRQEVKNGWVDTSTYLVSACKLYIKMILVKGTIYRPYV